jgi:sugar/nucleoside kinase (ribokinase family)
MQPQLAAVGEVLLDITMPQLVPGRVVHAPIEVSPGGTPVNAALAARALGAEASIFGRVGADAAGSAIRAALTEAGIDAHLAIDRAAPTGTFAEAGEGSERAVVADRGASANLVPDDLPTSLAAGAVLVSGYALLHDDSGPAAVAALRRAVAPWIAVSMGPPGLIQRCGVEEVHARARGAGVFLANEAEAAALTGCEPEEAARELGRRYEIACVTIGARGAVAATGGRIERAAPPSAAPGEVTGTGDAFAGVLLVSLARGAELGEALNEACARARRLACSSA